MITNIQIVFIFVTGIFPYGMHLHGRFLRIHDFTLIFIYEEDSHGINCIFSIFVACYKCYFYMPSSFYYRYCNVIQSFRIVANLRE